MEDNVSRDLTELGFMLLTLLEAAEMKKARRIR
jgi:hypothetical protein